MTREDPKAVLRKEILALRAGIAPHDRRTWEARIQDAILRSQRWGRARGVMAYWAMRGEVATDRVLQTALSQGKRLFLPRCVPGQRRFEAVQVLDLERDLGPGPFRGLRQPLAALAPCENPNELDLLIIPGIAFDLNGIRLGFGAGMFDRFLAECRAPYRLGVAFDAQVVDEIPSGPHDAPVQAILTETQWIEVGRT